MKTFISGLAAMLSAFTNAKDSPATPKTADVYRWRPSDFVAGPISDIPGSSIEKSGTKVVYRSVHGDPTKALEVESSAYAVEPTADSRKSPRHNVEVRANYTTVYGENDAVMDVTGYLDKEITTTPPEYGYVKVQWHHVGSNPPDKASVQTLIDQTYTSFKVKPADGTHDENNLVLTLGAVQTAGIPGLAGYGQ